MELFVYLTRIKTGKTETELKRQDNDAQGLSVNEEKKKTVFVL